MREVRKIEGIGNGREDEYIKRCGKRYCYEWLMRVKVDESYHRLSKKIKVAQRKMTTLTAISIVINLVISFLLHKWK